MSIYHDYRRLNVGDTHPGTGEVVTQDAIDRDNFERLLQMADDAEERAKQLRRTAYELKFAAYNRTRQQEQSK
ncbi:hypothetical protein [Pseudomonas sp. Kh13]|uniref:hypothetical protein n=1 Tax=Pseudomonas sp. Kh13 TaxID=2093744 RepID=UPI0011828A7A|nr:hypothetical protein [Pseudomonas sp. Kh13]